MLKYYLDKTGKVIKSILFPSSEFVDTEPRPGSLNPITSGAVAGIEQQTSANIAEAFSTSSTYAIGEVVIGPDGKLYQCTTAVTTAGEWDPDDWDETSLASVLAESGVNDIDFIGTGDDASAVAGKDQAGAKTASSCVAFGYGNMKNSGAAKNVAFGKENLQNSTGIGNCAFGYHAIYRGTTGTMNSAFGSEALDDDTTGSYNTGFGAYSLQRNSQGTNNTAVGYRALKGDVEPFDESASWSYNVAIGYDSLALIKSGAYSNVAIGSEAAKNIGNGKGNVAIGSGALKGVTGVENCIAIGKNSATAADGNAQLWIGASGSANLTKNNIIIYGEMSPSDMSAQFLRINGQIELPNLPTSDPQIAGRLWNDNGVLKISAGNV